MLRRHPLRLVVPLASTALFAGLLTGCGAIADRVGDAVAEKAVEGAIGADIQVDEGEQKVTISGDDGSMTMATKLPDEWPSSVPLPKDHVVASAITMDEGDGPAITAVLQVPDASFDDLVAELDRAFAKSEWTAAGEAPTTADMGEIKMWMQQFTSGDQELHVQVSQMEDELSVLYQVQAATAG